MKKVFRLFLAGLFAAVCTAGLFTGCSDGDETLSFWAYQPAEQEHQNAFKELLSEFTAETGIAVKPNFVEKDNYRMSLNSALGSKKKPDVAYLDQPMIADYAADGTLYDMTQLFTGSDIFKKERFFDGAYETSVYGGKNYAVPLNITTSVLFYNKALVTESNKPADWNAWKAFTVSSDKALFEGIGNGGYASWYFQVFLESAGGKFVNETNTAVAFNSDAGKAAAQFVKDLYAKSPSANRAGNAFGDGKVFFKLGSSSDIDRIKTSFPALNFGVMLIPPSSAGGVSKSNIGGENLVIFSSSKKKTDAQKLIEFILKKDNMQKISSYTGNFAAVKEYAVADSSDANYELKRVVLTQLETAAARPALPKWITVNDDYLSSALEKILSDTDPKDITEELNSAAQKANQLLFAA